MKKSILKFIKNNWIIFFMLIAIQLKSILLLGMLRTEGSESFNIYLSYFGVPAIFVHIVIIFMTFSVIYFFNKKNMLRAAIVIDLVISCLFILDIWYYRGNGTFLSIRHILYPEIFNPMGTSLMNFHPIDLLFLIDCIVLVPLIRKKENIVPEFKTFKTRMIKGGSFLLISLFMISIAHIAIDKKNLLEGTNLFRYSWAQFQTYSDMSPLGYHFYDLYNYKFVNESKVLSEDEDKQVEKWISENKENIPDNKYKGIYDGKNVVAIQVESLENFVINQKVHGQEITPTLNKILSNSLYFDNIYEQNNNGTSSDADFMVNASMFPIRKSTAFMGYPWVSYNTIQNVLNKEGYNTISTHAESGGNWNWVEPHKAFKAKEIWDINDFNIDEVIGPGLSDESYLKQIANKLKDKKEPYYTFIATLTSHGPFHIPEEKKLLDLPKDLDENLLGAYFQSIRYTDEAIKTFLEELDKNGQLENTVVIIYGDHGGVNKFYKDQIKEANLEGDWWNTDKIQIPLIVYNPNGEGEVISKVGGQVDFLPTILYLLGVDRKDFDWSAMGRVLVNTNRDAIILNNGEIIGEVKNPTEEEHLKNTFNIADMIIKGNYFR